MENHIKGETWTQPHLYLYILFCRRKQRDINNLGHFGPTFSVIFDCVKPTQNIQRDMRDALAWVKTLKGGAVRATAAKTRFCKFSLWRAWGLFAASQAFSFPAQDVHLGVIRNSPRLDSPQQYEQMKR